MFIYLSLGALIIHYRKKISICCSCGVGGGVSGRDGGGDGKMASAAVVVSILRAVCKAEEA